jgi:hypothetical protein
MNYLLLIFFIFLLGAVIREQQIIKKERNKYRGKR